MSLDRPTLEVVASLVDQITAPLRSTADGIKGVFNDIKNSALEMAAGFLAFDKLKDFLLSSVDAARDARESIGSLQLAIDDTGASLGQYGVAAEAAVRSVSALSQYTDVQLRGALGRLITDTGDTSGSITNLSLVADIAAARHIDLGAAADIVAKAMEGNTASLKKSGIEVNVLLPIIPQLVQRFHDAAEQAQALDGGSSDLTKSLESLKISFGEFFDAVNTKTGVVDKLATTFSALATAAAHPITTFKLLMGMNTSLDDAIAMGQDHATAAVKTGSDARVAVTKQSLAQMQADADADAAHQMAGIAKLQKAVTDAEANKLAVIKQVTDAAGKTDETGNNRIRAADTTLATAQQALRAAVAKSAEESSAKTTAAQDKVAAADATLLSVQQKFTDQFLKDFSADMPAAVTALEVKINDIAGEIVTLRTKEQEASKNATSEAAAGHAAAATAWSAESDALTDTIAGLQAMQARYESVRPVIGLVAGLAQTVAAADSDPKVPQTLDEINDRLTLARGLRAELLAAGYSTASVDTVINNLIKDQNTNYDEQSAKLKALGGTQNDAVAAHNKDVAAAKQLNQQIEQGADQVLDMAGNAGIVSQQFVQIAESAVKIGVSLSDGDVLGAIGGFGSLLEGLFGDTPENAAAKALLQRNVEATNALAFINGKLVLANDTGAQISGFQALGTGGPFGLGGLGSALQFGSQGNIKGVSIASVQSLLAPMGLSVDEMRNVAKDLGIDLGENNGLFSGPGVQAFLAAVTKVKPVAFADTFQGGLDAATLSETVQGNSGLTLDDYKNVATGANGSSFISSLFKGLDFKNPADLATLRTRLAGAASQLESGGFSLSSLGGLSETQAVTTVSDIATIVNQMLSATPSTSGVATTSTADTSTSVASDTTSVDTGVSTTAPSAGYTIPSDGVPASDLGTDLSPLIAAITTGFKGTNDRQDTQIAQFDGVLVRLEDLISYSAATANALAGGGFLRTVNVAAQAAADLSRVNGG